MDGMVMRSIYLAPLEDGQLRQLAHDLHVSKSDLIRSAIGAKLKEWLQDETDRSVLADLEFGLRDPAGRNDPRFGSSKAAAVKAVAVKRRESRGRDAGDQIGAKSETTKSVRRKGKQPDGQEAHLAMSE